MYGVAHLYNVDIHNKVYKKTGGAIMREQKYHLYMDSDERRILLESLVELKNQLIRQGRYTDCVDEIIIRLVDAPIKKIKVEYI